MKRIVFTMLTVLLSTGLYAQVGINTEDPKASLDIVANTASPTANGLLVPRLTATQVQTMETQVGDDQNALLVYVTATFTASPTDARYTDIDAIGYYYYDATDNTPNGKWKKLGSNPYTAGAGIEIGGNVVSATGLERSVVSPTNATYYNDYYAWSLIGRDKQMHKYPIFGKPQYLLLGYGAVDLSHGEENTTKSPTGASGKFSFASGEGTTASGYGSTAMGIGNTASGSYSTAMGVGTIASDYYSVAMGSFNATSTGALLMVGNGTSPVSRKNVLTVYRSGTIVAKNIYDTEGSIGDKVVVVDSDGELKSITRERLVRWSGVNVTTSRTKYTGTRGVWTKNGGYWSYTGDVVILAQYDGGAGYKWDNGGSRGGLNVYASGCTWASGIKDAYTYFNPHRMDGSKPWVGPVDNRTYASDTSGVSGYVRGLMVREYPSVTAPINTFYGISSIEANKTYLAVPAYQLWFYDE